MLPNKAGFELLEPAMGASIGSSKGFRGCEGYAGATGPLIHIADIAGENDFGFGLRRVHIAMESLGNHECCGCAEDR